VIQPMKMAWEIEKQNKMFWFSKTGKPQTLYTKLIPVKECFKSANQMFLGCQILHPEQTLYLDATASYRKRIELQLR